MPFTAALAVGLQPKYIMVCSAFYSKGLETKIRTLAVLRPFFFFVVDE